MSRQRLKQGWAAAATAVLSLAWPACAPAAEHSPEVTALVKEADNAIGGGRYQDALALARQALEKEPQAADIHNELGYCYVNMRRFPEATAEFKQALNCQPDFIPALHNLGSVLYQDGLYTDAIACLEKEVSLRPAVDPETLTSLADAYRDRANYVGGPTRDADYEQAFKYYKQALAADPTLPRLHNHLGVYYFLRNRPDLAETEIKKAIDLKHDYADAYFYLGLVAAKRHNLPEAAQAFRDSLRYESDPKYKEQVRRKMAQLGIPVEGSDYMSRSYDLLTQNRFAEAAAVLQQAVAAQAAKNPVAWNNLGYSLARQGKYREAITSYHRAVSLLPKEFPSAQYNLGQALRMVGDLDRAESCLKLAVEQAGGMNALAHNALGLVYRQRKQLELAKSEYKLAIMQSGDTLPVVHFNLALVLEHEPNQRSEALKEYRRYLEQAPDGLNAATARARLDALNKNT